MLKLLLLLVLLLPNVMLAQTGNNIVLGTLNTDSTFRAINIELLFSGDINANSTAEVDFRKAGEQWQQSLPLWATRRIDHVGPAYYGSVVLLDHGTDYEIRITVNDPDGGGQTLTRVVSTRLDDITDTFVPTHEVPGDYDTLEEAMYAPSGAVVYVNPGFYQAPQTTRTQPLTLYANGDAYIEGAVAGPWQLYQPNIWRWTAPFQAGQMGFASNRTDLLRRLPEWRKEDGSPATTLQGWIDLTYTHQNQHYGFYTQGNTIYLRMYKDLNPNDYVIKVGGTGNGIHINGSDVRIHGFIFHQTADYQVELGPQSHNAIISNNVFNGGEKIIAMQAAGKSSTQEKADKPSTYGSGHVIQNNRCEDIGLWSEDPNNPPISRNFVKGSGGFKYGARSEVICVWGEGGARNITTRNNTSKGTFDFTGGYHYGYDRYSMYGADIHSNMIYNAPDDAFDMSRANINMKIYNNYVERSVVFLSTNLHWGPLYVFNNVAWDMTHAGTKVTTDATGTPGFIHKYGGSSSPPARVYVINNTFWTDEGGGNIFNGGSRASEVGNSCERFYLRNNIYRVTRAAMKWDCDKSQFDEDYNHFVTSHASAGMEGSAGKFTTNVAGYRTAYNMGWHSNVLGNFVDESIVDSELVDPVNGNLRLKPNSKFIGLGVPVANIGSTDLGAYSSGAPQPNPTPTPGPTPTPVPPQVTKPNIVLILVDDMAAKHLPLMPYLASKPNGKWIDFPNTFTHFPLCCPSRATLLSGQYAHHHEVNSNNNYNRFLNEELVALPVWLQNADYQTAHIGKYLNGYPLNTQSQTYVPPGWDYWAAFYKNPGYGSFTLNENGVLNNYNTYSTDLLRARAETYVTGAQQPFFLKFAPNAPHSPHTPAQRHTNMYLGQTWHTPNFNEADVSDKPNWVKGLPLVNVAAIETDERKAAQSLLAVDEAIQGITNALNTRGILNNTVIMFVSDNGYSWGSHRWESKTCGYDECTRTPLLIRNPNTATSYTDNRLISNVDFASTIAEFAGATPLLPQDGMSVFSAQHDAVLLRGTSNAPVTPYWGVRTLTHAYLELNTGEKELYDLAIDPWQLSNVANQPAYAVIQAQLAAQLIMLRGF